MAQAAYDNREAVTRSNEKFENYYKLQKIVPEGQWEQFMDSIKSDLPITFRLVSHTVHFEQLRAKTEEICQRFPDLCQPIKWYPGGCAYQLNVSRNQLRMEPRLKEFHQMIIIQAEAGTMFRQEAVSMIPVALLDVQPEHAVIDLCAAPGSKTSQILERMHSLWEERGCPDGSPYPPGVCVANDFSPKRAHMLIHHVSALNSPSLVVTTRSAQLTPNMFLEDTGDRVQYDRVLADVPCSGDGTLRKAPALWPKWIASIGTGLHRLQLQIAKRGAHLLRVGGRMVYSTCSLNPMENESVVAALIRDAKGALRIVDSTQELQGLERLPGLHSWVVGWNEEVFTSYDQVPPNRRKKVQETCFPPATEEEAVELGLSRCMRFLPHLSNTGGFFVAVIEKVAECPWETPLTQRKKDAAALTAAAAVTEQTEEESADVSKKVKMSPAATPAAEDEEEDAAEAADVAQLAAEQEAMEALGEADALLTLEGVKEKLSKQEQLEQEDAKLEVFRKRTRCVDFETLSNVDAHIKERLWASAAHPLGMEQLTEELAGRLLVRTSAAEARHRQLEQRKELMKRERAQRMGHKKKNAPKEGEATEATEAAAPAAAEEIPAAPVTEEVATPDAAVGEGRGVPEVPRRVWLCSKRAGELLRSKGRAPYKVLHAGVPVWERNRAPAPAGATADEAAVWNTYRPSMACGQWLLRDTVDKVIAAAGEEVTPESAAAAVASVGLSHSLVVVPNALFVKVLASDSTPPRVHREKDLTEEEQRFFTVLDKERCALMVTKSAHGVLQAPLWVGRGNLEVLLDLTTKKSLKFVVQGSTATQEQA